MFIVALVILHLLIICYVPDNSHSHTGPFVRTDFKDERCIVLAFQELLAWWGDKYIDK